MPRYFFDVHIDRKVQRDDTGTDLATLEEVRKTAQRLLPDLAREKIPYGGDQRAIVVVTNEESHPVYAASLNYAGLWLIR
ncbi:DUF6894 family protein [Methylobacterium durans]|uniref:DUF6894 domain-containing protein n=1 Tax=Methylobacterium durans TaxID=2202825 RepID=A0A2U8W3Q7_9HYPH|nr:hypothetical protein [Methylobacterium durans]AWN40288.1 hypothetical protein DK389_06740 [Methylobacterium durans]